MSPKLGAHGDDHLPCRPLYQVGIYVPPAGGPALYSIPTWGRRTANHQRPEPGEMPLAVQHMRHPACLEEDFPPYSSPGLKVEWNAQRGFWRLACSDFCFLAAGYLNPCAWALSIFWMIFRDGVSSDSLGSLTPTLNILKIKNSTV